MLTALAKMLSNDEDHRKILKEIILSFYFHGYFLQVLFIYDLSLDVLLNINIL